MVKRVDANPLQETAKISLKKNLLFSTQWTSFLIEEGEKKKTSHKLIVLFW